MIAVSWPSCDSSVLPMLLYRLCSLDVKLSVLGGKADVSPYSWTDGETADFTDWDDFEPGFVWIST